MLPKKEKKKKKINALFLSANAEDELFMSNIHKYTTEHLAEKVRPFFRRVTNLFFFEWIFAIQRNLEHDLVSYISEYEFKKYTFTNREKFFTRLYFDCIGKMHFINSYSYLRKHNIDVIYVKDDTAISHIACIVAAHNLKIDVKILHEGYREEMLFVDANATRFRNSLPRNVDFYQNLEIQYPKDEYSHNNHNENLILVLLQKDDSPEIILDSPFIKSQKHLLAIISNLAVTHPEYKFAVFNSDVEFHNTENVAFSQEDFSRFLPLAKAVVTVNATEAVLAFEHNKPVILLGNAFYSMNGLTINAGTEAELMSIPKKLEEFKFNAEIAGKYTSFIKQYYAIRCKNFKEPSEDDAKNILMSTLDFSSLQ